MGLPVLIDSSLLIAAMNARETHHGRAAAALESSATSGVLVPVTILAETMGLVGRRYGLHHQRRIWDAALGSALTILSADAALIEQARAIDRAYEDVGFGFADCMLLATCERERIARVLSFDRQLAAYRPSFAAALEVLP
ncbi:MAG: hypothetical protein C0418_02005 [Coriobacteriaceae bacterium]|nr:hypothetical protein [Coriobacteriaceae bacterium]